VNSLRDQIELGVAAGAVALQIFAALHQDIAGLALRNRHFDGKSVHLDFLLVLLDSFRLDFDAVLQRRLRLHRAILHGSGLRLHFYRHLQNLLSLGISAFISLQWI